MSGKFVFSWWTIALVSVIAVLALVATYVLRGASSMSFDKAKWLDTESYEKEPYIRLEMVKDLINNRLSQGLSRSEVTDLLGPPTQTEKFAQYDLVYWLGIEKGFIRIDSTWLVIKMDDAAGLVESRTLND